MALSKQSEFKMEFLDRLFYPADEILCHLASVTYKDRNDIEENLREVQNLKGWKLITSWRNDKDGYFGASFWHEKHRHFVISHRGTDSLKDVIANWQGVIRKKDTSQRRSAFIFAFDALREAEKYQHFSISITGHSLGGWLAQLTAFAIEYLEEDFDEFRGLDEEKRKYHPHTVTFDSPGCFESLCKMAKHYFYSYKDRPYDLISGLSMTTYFLAPNSVNSKNEHEGELIRLDFIVEDYEIKAEGWREWIGKKIIHSVAPHTVEYHDLSSFLNAFQERDILKYNVLGWPEFSVTETLSDWFLYYLGYYGHKEDQLAIVYDYADKSNRFHPNLDNLNKNRIVIPLKFEDFDECFARKNIFKENENIFLKNWERAKKNFVVSVPEEINIFFEKNNLGSFHDFLPNFQIKKKEIKADNKDDLIKIVSRIKWLFVYFPEVSIVLKKQITPLVAQAMFKTCMSGYLQKLPNYEVCFSDTIGLENFLNDDIREIMVLRSKRPKDEAFRVYNILQQIDKYQNKYLLFGHKDLEELGKEIDVVGAFESQSITDTLLIIDCEDLKKFEIVNKFNLKILNGAKKKIICIGKKLKFSNFEYLNNVVKEAMLTDLDKSSLNRLLDRNIISLNGNVKSLRDFCKTDRLFTALSSSISFDILKEYFFVPRNVTKLNFENKHFKKIFFGLTTAKVEIENMFFEDFEMLITNYESVLKPIINKPFNKVKFLVTNAYSRGSRSFDSLKNFKDQIVLDSAASEDDGFKVFKELCLKYPNMTIFRLHVITGSCRLNWTDVFDFDLYIERNPFHNDSKTDLVKRCEKVTLISNEPGMGKSTLLLSLTQKLRNNWIFWINLIDAHQYINDWSYKNLDGAVLFLLKFSNNSSKLTKSLLKFSLQNKNSLKVCIFCDGYDEIQDVEEKDKEEIQDKILKLFKFLKNETSAELYISTRVHDTETLENELRVSALKLKDISPDEQTEFYIKYWKLKLCLTCMTPEMVRNLESYARKLIKYLNSSIDRRILSLLGIPLQLKMVSEIFQPSERHYYNFYSFESYFNMYDLYLQFEEKKYEIYFKDKVGFTQISHKKELKKNFKNNHRILGMKRFFPKFKVKNFDEEDKENLNRLGFVQINGLAWSFVHETFAEYFAAEYLVSCIRAKSDEGVQSVLLNVILMKPQFAVVRRFINDIFISKKQTNSELLNFFPEIWEKEKNCKTCKSFQTTRYHAKCKYTILHTLVKENNAKFIEFLLENFKNNVNLKDEVINAQDFIGNTPLYVAMRDENIEICSILLKYQAKVDIRNRRGETCLHLAAGRETFNAMFSEIGINAEVSIQNNDARRAEQSYQNWRSLVSAFQSFTGAYFSGRSRIGEYPYGKKP